MIILTTERLRLRHLGPEDTGFLLDLLNQPSFIANIGDRGVRTLEDAGRYMEERLTVSYRENGFGLYLCETIDEGVPIGICGLVKRPALDDVDLGYALLPEHWSKGYAREAARATLQHARDLGLDRLVAIVSPSNDPSIALLENLGFRRQSTIRLPGESVDVELFSRNL